MATTAEIHAAADRIAAEGGSPTLVAVRAAIGGGSFTTISEAMKVWKASRTAASAAPMREAAPSAVADRMAEVAGEVWAIALDLANQRLQAEREALDVARADAERGRADAIEAADAMGGELDTARGQLATQVAAHAAALEASQRQAPEAGLALDKLRAALAEQTGAAQVAQASLVEVRKHCEQLAALFIAEQERGAEERTHLAWLAEEGKAAREKTAQIAQAAQERAAEDALKIARAEATAEQLRAELTRLIEDSKSARAEAAQALKVEAAARAAEMQNKAALEQAAANIAALGRDLEIARESERQAIAQAQQASSLAAAPAPSPASNTALAPIPAPADFDLAMTPNPAPTVVKVGGKAARKQR
jgi:hypothetical protein